MDYSAIAVRYSKALFSLSLEKSILDEIHKDFLLIKSICESELEFIRLLKFPTIASSKKIEIFNILFSGKVNNLTLEFLNLISKKRREAYLYSILLHFLHLYKEKMGIRTITFTSVDELSDSVRKSIREIFKSKYGNDIEIVEQTNKNLIGGFVLRLDDEQYDASVVRHLENIKRTLKA